MSPQRLSIVVLLVFVSVVLVKAYAIGIVWRCYKYLTIRQHNLRSMLPYIIPDMTAPGRDYNTLLPDYEEAIAQSMKQPPPPTYQMAMANMQATGLQVNLDNVPATDGPQQSVTNVTVTDSPRHSTQPHAVDAVAESLAEQQAPPVTITARTDAAEQQPKIDAVVKPYYSY